jgi:hypothetical protein
VILDRVRCGEIEARDAHLSASLKGVIVMTNQSDAMSVKIARAQAAFAAGLLTSYLPAKSLSAQTTPASSWGPAMRV